MEEFSVKLKSALENNGWVFAVERGWNKAGWKVHPGWSKGLDRIKETITTTTHSLTFEIWYCIRVSLSYTTESWLSPYFVDGCCVSAVEFWGTLNTYANFKGIRIPPQLPI